MKINRMTVGVDIAKQVFQLYWVDVETGEEMNLRLARAKFLRHFANQVPCLVALDACGGSQHWARRLQELGHEVRILPAGMVRAFVRGNKNDAHDARAIWAAVQQLGVHQHGRPETRGTAKCSFRLCAVWAGRRPRAPTRNAEMPATAGTPSCGRVM